MLISFLNFRDLSVVRVWVYGRKSRNYLIFCKNKKEKETVIRVFPWFSQAIFQVLGDAITALITGNRQLCDVRQSFMMIRIVRGVSKWLVLGEVRRWVGCDEADLFGHCTTTCQVNWNTFEQQFHRLSYYKSYTTYISGSHNSNSYSNLRIVHQHWLARNNN